MKLFKLRLRARIGLLGALVVLFSVILGIVAYNQTVKIKLYAAVNQKSVAVQFDVFKLSQSVENLSSVVTSGKMLPLLDSLTYKYVDLSENYVVSSYTVALRHSFEEQIKNVAPEIKKIEVAAVLRQSLQDSVLRYVKMLVGSVEGVSPELQLDALNYSKAIKKYFEQPSPSAFSGFDIIGQRLKQASTSLPINNQVIVVGYVTSIQNLSQQILKTDAELGFDVNQGLRGSLLTKLSLVSLSVNELSLVINKVTESSRNEAVWSIVISLFLLLLTLGLFIREIIHSVAHPLLRIRAYMVKLVKGSLPEPLILKGSGEDGVRDMAHYLNRFVQSLKDKAAFADEIGRGKLDARYELLSDEDILGNSLLEMEKSLQRAEHEDHKYKLEEQKRIWANEGVARFSEILRLNSHNLQVLADEIVRNLVQYLNAGLGGLYLKGEDENQTYLELTAAFAYDRKKHLSQKIALGEGLVGTCAIEKLTVFITDLPDDYIRIRSGLGESIPKSLLLVPLKLEEELLGVIELASFTIFNKQEVEFAEKIAESIASTISTVRINARTTELLAQSQKQAEEMAEQEEEMRQNIEEIQATQEESARREQQFQSVLSAFNNAIMVAELDSNGMVLSANERLLQHASVDRSAFIKRNISDWISLDEKTPEWRAALSKANSGSVSTCLLPLRTTEGHDVWLECNLSPIMASGGKVPKILMLLIDASEQINTAAQLQQKESDIESLSTLSSFYRQSTDAYLPICEITVGGQIEKANALFCKIVSLTEVELVARKIISLVAESTLVTFENNLKQALKGASLKGELEFVAVAGKSVSYSLFPIYGTKGEIVRVMMFCNS